VGEDRRKDEFQSPDAIDSTRQDVGALILASKRLADELQALAERVQKLAAQQHVEIVKTIKRTQEDSSRFIAQAPWALRDRR
jgi:hypothetical protein